MHDHFSAVMNKPLKKTVIPKTSEPDNLEKILEVISSDIKSLESQILRDVKTDIPLLNNVAEHILSSGGKRLRPALVLLGAVLFGSVDERVMQAAQVIEYLHTATLLHDDVVDGAETRRAKQAVCRVWGNEASVLSGDYLLAMAFHRLTKLRNLEVLELMSETTTKMARGELLQLTRSFETANEEEYLEIIINKTACLFATAIKTGAILAGASSESADQLYDYGMALGISFQIVDDALDYADENKTGKPVGGDLQERKITLPLSHLLENANVADRLRLDSILCMKEIEKTQIDEVIDLMERYGSITYALEFATKHSNVAKHSIENFPASKLRKTLLDIADFIVSRQL
ncbi:MAG TPA: polyprenyl synthetase family protein [Candidatus Lambdaproteobacteria bacterium]|nr:polyprenyl synthetase family protein [Candidatus Lambdaproteobacteria bacterium]HIO84400.1 polyprenyl synthetase family protein [Deltaproteobacteria bacterium]